jgi:flagellar hook-associated protein 2
MSSVSSTSSTSSQSVTGLASGMDWSTVISQLADVERAPETQWKAQQTSLNTQNSVFSTIKTDLTTLQKSLNTLQSSSLWEGTASTSSDSSVATVSTTSGAMTGTNTFDITQLATAAKMIGAGKISTTLAPSNDVSGVILNTAGFSTPITAGTFTINGKQVTVAITDSLQDVFSKIASGTNNAVTASYNATTDEITLSSSSPITLGSSADTSNFLQAARLYNNSSSSVSSTSPLGRVSTTRTMSYAGLATPISDGGSGKGEFTINGVSISYDASSDSIQNVLDRINGSNAEVTAAYDSVNNRFTLTNASTGDLGISMKDVTGNFLAATGLSSGTLTRGQNLLYTLNGGTQQLVSQSNTITSATSGINGLSVTALNTGTTSVTVGSDTSPITSAINQFITDYNAVQDYISSQQITITASNGNVSAGPLTADQTANNIASTLRSTTFSPVSGLAGAIQMLADLGIQTNGQSNTITLSNPSTLDNALANHLSNVKSFFTDATNGWAKKLNSFLDATISDNGTLVTHQATLTTEYDSIATQITNLEKKIASDSAFWTSEFTAMETAQAKATQELTYLTQQISSTKA